MAEPGQVWPWNLVTSENGLIEDLLLKDSFLFISSPKMS